VPIPSRQLPYQLQGSSYVYDFSNDNGSGLWIYNLNPEPTLGITTVHLSAHVSDEWFSELHLTPDHGPWQRYHAYFRNGSFTNDAGWDHCREVDELDAWVKEHTSALDVIGADFWNAAMALGAQLGY
jgi:hypothetical protein